MPDKESHRTVKARRLTESLAVAADLLVFNVRTTDRAFVDAMAGDELVHDVDWYVDPIPWYRIYCQAGGYEIHHAADGYVQFMIATLRYNNDVADEHERRPYRGDLVRGLDRSMTRADVTARLGAPRWTYEWDRPGWGPSIADYYDGQTRLVVCYPARDTRMSDLTLMPPLRVYDDTSWPRGDGLPASRSPQDAAIRMGLFLAWALTIEDDYYARLPDDDRTQMFRDRRIAPEAYVAEVLGGALTDEHLWDSGNHFARRHYAAFVAEFSCLVADEDVIAADSWDLFDRVRPSLDQLRARWHARFEATEFWRRARWAFPES